jgi:AraC-like DNA-binding protein
MHISSFVLLFSVSSRIPGSKFRCAGMKISYLGDPTMFMPGLQTEVALNGASACDLLACEHMSVAETALAVGYQSDSGFSTSFSRETGRSPKEFIKGH